ncbi:MAG: Hsp33 family molecular chaperone HslO [Pseudomonadota bacterium]
MSSDTTPGWDDTILPFQLDRADIRGRVGRLDQVLEQVLGQHDYPMPVAALVAETCLLTALIGQTISLRWKLSIQVNGDGPIRRIATDYFGPTEAGAPARMRGWASFDADKLTEAPAFSQLGRGMFAILIDQGTGMQPYQGITPLSGTSVANCAETYFAQSEQLPTRFALGVAQAEGPQGGPKWRAGGIMVQHMPKASPFAKDGPSGEDGLLTASDIVTGDDAENWNRVVTLLETVELTELLGPHVSADSLLLRLFHEETPRVYDPQPVRFGCTCGPDKVRQSLSIYSAKDIGHMTNEQGQVTADCQFCGAHYAFDPKTLGFEAEHPVED